MIEVADRGGIVVVRLNDGKANVLDLELCEALDAELVALEAGNARAVVLTGRGRSFSAGVDLLRVVEGGADYVASFLPALSRVAQRVFAFPKPVVAAINGHAIAGGCLIACAADVRLMAGGSIGVPELQVGVPFPAVALEILRHAVGTGAGYRLALSGRLLGPEEAVDAGLVDAAVEAEELDERAMERATSLASIPPAAFAATKRQFRAPAFEHLERRGAAIDREVVEIWSQPEILAVIRGYVERTLKKAGG